MTEKRTLDQGATEKLDLRSLDVAEGRRQDLLRIFPEIETEGGRTGDDLLHEILLKSGFRLTTPVEALELCGKRVHSVEGGKLLICLDRGLTLELIRAMAARTPERVVCLDEGFARNDQLKANAVQTFKTKGVTRFQTV